MVSVFVLRHTLGCWCHPRPCHAHVLVRLIEEIYDTGTVQEPSPVAVQTPEPLRFQVWKKNIVTMKNVKK